MPPFISQEKKSTYLVGFLHTVKAKNHQNMYKSIGSHRPLLGELWSLGNLCPQLYISNFIFHSDLQL